MVWGEGVGWGRGVRVGDRRVGERVGGSGVGGGD